MRYEQIEKKYLKRFNELPKMIQESISNADWLKEIRNIVSKNKLLLDQGLVIENLTFQLVLGLIHPGDYTKIVKKEANLSKKQAIEIAIEVDEKILSVIKRIIIEQTEKEMGLEGSPLDDIIGKNEEIRNSLPSIDTDLENEKIDQNTERKNLINELGEDIEIENEEADEELSIKNQFGNLSKTQSEKEISTEIPENLPTGEELDQTSKSNKIPIIEDTNPNPRFIETNFSKQPDNLPNLEPVRTLETDSENRDDIVTSKLAGAEIKKPKVKSKGAPETPQKTKGPDPYREDFK